MFSLYELTCVLNLCNPVNIDMANIFSTKTADQNIYALKTSLSKDNKSKTFDDILHFYS